MSGYFQGEGREVRPGSRRAAESQARVHVARARNQAHVGEARFVPPDVPAPDAIAHEIEEAQGRAAAIGTRNIEDSDLVSFHGSRGEIQAADLGAFQVAAYGISH